MKDTAAAKITQAVLAIFRTNGRLLEWGDRLLSPLGLTSARWQMLGAVALSETPQTAPQLAAAMGVTRQGAQKQLDLLMNDGLIAARPNVHHRRSPLYELTDRGAHAYTAVDRLWTAQAGRMAAGFRAEDVAAAQRFLTVLQQWLSPSNPRSSR